MLEKSAEVTTSEEKTNLFTAKYIYIIDANDFGISLNLVHFGKKTDQISLFI